MIKKVIKKLKKAFIPQKKIDYSELEAPIHECGSSHFSHGYSPYIGVPAPITTPTDTWFSAPVKTEKVIAHEEKVAEVVKQKEAEQPKSKEPENIHQQMYERVSNHWGTWKEELQSPGGSENFQSGWNSGNGMGQFK
jgi:hypothetical protein